MGRTEELFKALAEAASVRLEDFVQRVMEKQRMLGGLVSPEVAALLVARELGVDVRGFVEARSYEAPDLVSGIRTRVKGVVVHVDPARRVKVRGREKVIASFLLADDRGRVIEATVWNARLVERVRKLRRGQVVKIDNGSVKVEGGSIRVNVNRGLSVVDSAPEGFKWPPETNLRIFGEVKSVYRPLSHPELEAVILDSPEGLVRVVGEGFGGLGPGWLVEMGGLRLRRRYGVLVDYVLSVDGEIDVLERGEGGGWRLDVHDAYLLLGGIGGGYVDMCGELISKEGWRFVCGGGFCIPIRGAEPPLGGGCLRGVGLSLVGDGKPVVFFDSYSGLGGECECGSREPPLMEGLYYYIVVNEVDVRFEQGRELPVVILSGGREVRAGPWLVGELGGRWDADELRRYLEGRIVGAVWTGEYFRLKTVLSSVG